MSSREQVVACDAVLSEFANVNTEVPQGSILGLTLYLLFLNNLPLFSKHCILDFFADVMMLRYIHIYSKSVSVTEKNILLVNDFNETKQWSKCNKLPVNFNKTTRMTTGSRKRLADSRQMELKLDDVHIQTVTKQKLLGVYLDENLNWSAHIDYLCSNISSKTAITV